MSASVALVSSVAIIIALLVWLLSASSENPEYYVEIVRQPNDVVEKRLGPYSLSAASRIAQNADRNLSLDYAVRVVEK